MQDSVKSALVVPLSKKSTDKPPRDIEYKQVSNANDAVGELSDEEKEAEFHKQHEQYMKMKMERKQALIRLKKQQFGTSSSEDNDSSEQQIEQIKTAKKTQSKGPKASRGKLQAKPQPQPQSKCFPVVQELKKATVESELRLHEVEFQLAKKLYSYARINKLGISKSTLNGRTSFKLRIGVAGDEDLLLSSSDKPDKTKMGDIFTRFFQIKMEVKSTKQKGQQSRCNPAEFAELGKGALIFDRILKKSQVFGKWEERYIVVRPEGLQSYPSLKDKPTMWIPRQQVSELTTQFEWVKDSLVFKLIYNGTKTDFGLPVDGKAQWVSAFLALLQ